MKYIYIFESNMADKPPVDYDDEEMQRKAVSNASAQENKTAEPREEPQEIGVLTRVKGLAKTYFSALALKAYVGLTVITGGWFAGGVACAGVGASIIGFGMKKLGAALGWKRTERWGAQLQTYGARALAAPIYVGAWGIDGLGNMITGKDMQPGCVGYLNAVTNKISGIEQLNARDGIGQTPIIQNQQQMEEELEKAKQKQKELSEKSSVRNSDTQSVSEPSAPPHEEIQKVSEFAPPQLPVAVKAERAASEERLTSNETRAAVDVVQAMEGVKTHEEAKRVYNKNIHSDRAFDMLGEPKVNEDGTTTIVWKPKGSTDEKTYVTLTYDHNKNVIAHSAGESATAILPPIKTENGFKIDKYEEGKLIAGREVIPMQRVLAQNAITSPRYSSRVVGKPSQESGASITIR